MRVRLFPRLLRVGAVLMLCVAACASSLEAQQVAKAAAPQTAASQINGAIDSSQRVRLANSVHPLVAQSVDAGSVSAGAMLSHMLLVLEPPSEKKAALKQFMIDQQNPASPSYHQWLTPQQFGERFGPSQQDVNALVGWLSAQGMSSVAPSASRRWIDFSGPVRSVEAAFQTSIHRIQVGSTTHIANVTEVSIPSALTSLTGGIVRLNDIYAPTPVRISGRFTQKKGEKPVVTSYDALRDAVAATATQSQLASSDGTQFLAPGDLAQIYNTTALKTSGIDGTGVSIAVIGRSNIQIADIQSFQTLFKLKPNLPEVIMAGADPGLGSGDELESALDVEYAGALAQGANIKFVIAQSTDTADGVDLAAAYAVDHLVAPVLSESYGLCEAFVGTAGNKFYNALWQQAAAEGISVLISSGDGGSAGCDAPASGVAAQNGLQVSGLASTPYNTAVGGTMFDPTLLHSPFWSGTNQPDFTSALGYTPELVWDETCNPTLPFSATGNCAAFAARPRFAYPILYASSGGASSCTASSAVSLPSGAVDITCTDFYAKPSWQTGIGVPQDKARDIPDVSLTAAGGFAPYTICVEGSCQYVPDGSSYGLYGASFVGGTSASTPVFAGIASLLNQKLGAAQGLLNPRLYGLASAEAGKSCDASSETDPTVRTTCVFHDITHGSNRVPCVGGTQNCSVTDPTAIGTLAGYDAGKGYDLATGWGSVDVTNLVNAWANSSLAATTTTLAMPVTSATHGQALAISGKVAAASGTAVPSGLVSLKTSSGVGLGAFPLTNGSYATSVDSLPGGSYTVVAHYAGDASFAVSDSGNIAVTISAEPSTTTASVRTGSTGKAITTFQYGDQILLRADVAGASGHGIATGNMTLSLDGKALTTVPVNVDGSVEVYSGFYTNPGVFPAVGPHSLSASFAGDSGLNASTSTPYPFTVAKVGVTTAIAGGTYSPLTNQAILLRAYVTSLNPGLPVDPTGSVQLYDNGVAIGTPVTLAGIQQGAQGSGGSLAELSYAFPTAGDHHVTATYAGDSTFAAVTPDYITDTTFTVSDPVGAASAVAASTSSLNPALGQGVSFVIQVTPKTASAAAPIPQGTVTLTGSASSQFSGITPPVVSLNGGGVASLQYAFTSAGSTPVYFAYSGDANYAPSSGAILPIVVSKATPGMTLTTNAALSLPGAQTVLQTVLTSSTTSNAVPRPLGAVQFYDSINGAAAVPLGAVQNLSLANGLVNFTTASVATLTTHLATGSHSIYAVFPGDFNFTTQTSPTVQVTVSNPDFVFGAAPAAIALAAGASATGKISLQPVLGFAGNVALACDPSSLPVGVQCTVSPTTVSGANGSATVTLTASTPGPMAALEHGPLPWGAGACVVSCVTLLFGLRRRRFTVALVAVLMAISLTLAGCGNSPAPAPSTTTVALSSSSSKIATGSTVTFTAALTTTDSSTLTGGVTFFADGAAVGQPGAISAGNARLNLDNLVVGIHTMTASYSGDSGHQGATSNRYLQAVTGTTSVRIVATSGSLSHSLTLPVQLQ